MQHYTTHLENKVVFCNTDNYKHSNFVKYFKENFHKLKLKKLHALDLQGNHFTYDGYSTTLSKVEDGDFRGEYSIELLKESDVVVTNPPFSLFREYVTQLMEYKKHFLIIGNYNSVTYKDVFPLIKDEKIRLGYTSPKEFIQPGGSVKKFGNISWFTSFDIGKNREFMKLYHSYKGNEDKYPKYDNYDAIEVSRVSNIPKDYEDVMGVPVTILDKYNPNQFKILDITNSKSLYRTKEYTREDSPNYSGMNNRGVVIIDNKPVVKYARVLIKKRRKGYEFSV